MGYEYTIDDILETPFHYHYTAYRGKEFMQDWYSNRKDALSRLNFDPSGQLLSGADWPGSEDRGMGQGTGEKIILRETLHVLLYTLMKKERLSEDQKKRLDGCVKTFEVRKRLYPVYSERFKPEDEDGYQDMGLYTGFACVCAAAYEAYQDLRFLNALLKVNDTLLSQLGRRACLQEPENQERLAYALGKELDFIMGICREKGWEMDEE